MRSRNRFWHVCVLGILFVEAGVAPAAGKRKQPQPVPLTGAGQKLEMKYQAMLTGLQAKITQALPKIDAGRRAKFLAVFADEAKAGKYSHKNPDFVKATQNTAAAAKGILDSTASFLAGDRLDGMLVKATVIAQATPRGLAAFAQRGPQQEAMIDTLLADTDLMKQMLIAGGAHDGDYGRTMEMHAAIEKASPKARSGVLPRLALATSLDQVSSQGGPLDPVVRYQDFEQAYLHGELDPAFAKLTTWELRMVVDEPYTDEDIKWVRQMVKNYRPDVMKIDYRWRYTEISTDEVKYTTMRWDLVPGPKAAQIIASGGKCGPRAWFGRLASRAFGIPVWGEQQPGHAAWTHWTPDGWIICQGADWDICHWYGQPGMDFLLESQARQFPEDFMKVLRAQWLGDTFGETRFNGNHLGVAGFWPALALAQQRAMVAKNHPRVAQRTGPNHFWRPIAVPSADKRIEVSATGKIVIPAVASTRPSHNTEKIRFMKSGLGGMQLHYAHLGKPETFEYTFVSPAAGKYNLTARVVTVTIDQELLLTVNGAKTPIKIPVPYTAGMWGKTQPVQVELARGKNVFSFARDNTKDVRGVTIKDFTLTPAK